MGFYVNVEPGVNVYVEDINPGGKKTIFWIHGWPGDHTLFEYQYNEFPKHGYRCVGVDTRGFGKSDRPWDGYGYDRLADDTRAVIDALQLKDVTLAGHSTGGAIALRYMARHRGHGVAKLALLAAAAPSLIQRPYFPYGQPRSVVEGIINGTYTNRPLMLQNFGNMIFHNHVTPGISDWIFSLGLAASSWGTAAIANTWLDEEGLFKDMEAVNAPTLILHGLDDKVCLYPLAEAMHKGIRGSTLVPFASCGHFLFYDQLEKFNAELYKFTES